MIKHRAFLTSFSFLSMLFLGLSGSIVGAAAKNIGLSPYQIGIIIASQNVGFIISVLLSGILSDTVEKTKLLFIGSIILGISFLFFYKIPSYIINVFIMFFIGFGTGIYEGTTDVMLLEIHKRNKSLFININHFFVNLGSLFITIYLIFLEMNWRKSMIQSGIMVLILGFLYLFSKIEDRSISEVSTFKRLNILIKDSKTIIAIFILTTIAVGMETGTIGIITSFLMDLRGFNQLTSKIGLITFVSGIASGRLLVGYISKRFENKNILKLFFASGAILYTATFFFDIGNLIFLFIFLTGLTVSALLPLLITLTGNLYPDFSGTALGIIKMGIPVGGIIIPLIISFISKYFSFLASLIIFPVADLAGLLLLILSVKKLYIKNKNEK